MSSGSHDPTSSAWGSEVIEDVYGGHAGLVYASRPRSVVDLIDPEESWPGRIYLVQGERRFSHEQFRRAIPRGAALLARRGVTRGDRVMVLAYNSPEFALALWSIWWLGAVAVFGNRWWHKAEADGAVARTAPALVLTDSGEGEWSVPVLPMSRLAATWDEVAWDEGAAPRLPAPANAEDDPALIVFTSGSTGDPKGVVLSQRSVVANQQNLLVRQRRLPGRDRQGDEQQVLLVCTPLFHIGGMSHILAPLITGGRLVLSEGRFDPGQVLGLIERERVQVFGGVPTMAIRVIEHPEFERFDLSSLRAFPLGGAPVPEPLLERMAEKIPQLQRRGLANSWGMTESGGYVTAANSADMARFPGTVGRPYPCAEIKTDSQSGEVMVRSPTVMLGYLGGPSGVVDADGWLRTGDVGHVNEEGYLFLDGRAKDIVIRGGENVACAHVERALLEHPDVAEAAVFGVPHPEWGETVAAVVVERSARALSPELLEAHLKKRLANFEIPEQWQFQREPLPTLPGEKVDKMRLRQQLSSGPGMAGR
jgi:acyl-CoA synthetase (AMP-forming)/AMP-acid ligase II